MDPVTIRHIKPDRRLPRFAGAQYGVAVVAGWLSGMLGAIGVIQGNAKIGSGPLSHPTATWWVAGRSAGIAAVVALLAYRVVGRKSFLIVGAVVGAVAPCVGLYLLYR